MNKNNIEYKIINGKRILYKKCSVCKQLLPETDFYVNEYSKLYLKCKKCYMNKKRVQLKIRLEDKEYKKNYFKKIYEKRKQSRNDMDEDELELYKHKCNSYRRKYNKLQAEGINTKNMLKYCPLCNEYKLKKDFNKKSIIYSKDGLSEYCTSCLNKMIYNYGRKR